MSLEANASAKVAVKVRCERCAHVYEYDVWLASSRRSITESRSADDLARGSATTLVAQLGEMHSGKHLGHRPCPKCSYIQSWMWQSKLDDRDTNRLLSSAALGLGTTVAVYWLGALAWIWNWVWILVFLAITAGIYQALGGALRPLYRRRDAGRLSVSTRPMEVRIVAAPNVSVVRETRG